MAGLSVVIGNDEKMLKEAKELFIKEQTLMSSGEEKLAEKENKNKNKFSEFLALNISRKALIR